MSAIKNTILITGASSGIGRAAARKMLAAGYHVIGTSRNCNQFSAHRNFTAIELNLSDPDKLIKQLPSIKKSCVAIDSVVFCAGYGQFSSLEEFSYQQIQNLIAVNFTSQVLLARALMPGLKQKTAANMIFIGSEAALKGSRKGAVYCASKFALRGFAQALRDECAKSNTRVSIINPGMVNTAFFDQLDFTHGNKHGNYILAHDVAEAIHFVISSQSGIVIDEINLSPLNKVINFK